MRVSLGGFENCSYNAEMRIPVGEINTEIDDDFEKENLAPTSKYTRKVMFSPSEISSHRVA